GRAGWRTAAWPPASPTSLSKSSFEYVPPCRWLAFVGLWLAQMWTCASAISTGGSDDPAVGEVGDLVFAVAEAGQDLLVVLPQLRRRGADRQPALAVADRVPQDREVSQRGRVHRLRHLQVLHLRIREGLVDPVDGAAGHTRVVQDADPLRAGLPARHRHDLVGQHVAVLGSRARGGEARVGAQVRALDGLAEALVDLVARRRDVDVAVLGLEDTGG